MTRFNACIGPTLLRKAGLIVVVLLVGWLAQGRSAYAQVIPTVNCVQNPGPTAVNMPLRNMTVGNNPPPAGTLLSNWVYSGSLAHGEPGFVCTQSPNDAAAPRAMVGGVVEYVGSGVSTGLTVRLPNNPGSSPVPVMTTNVPGIGLAISAYSDVGVTGDKCPHTWGQGAVGSIIAQNSCAFRLPSATMNVTTQFAIALVATGTTISAGPVTCDNPLARFYPIAPGNPLTGNWTPVSITCTPGQLVVPTCELSAADVDRTVQLPNVPLTQVPGSNNQSFGATPFSVTAVNCVGAKSAIFKFAGTPSPVNGADFKNTGTAEGLGLQLSLASNQQVIPANGTDAARTRTVAVSSNTAVLNLLAAYVREGPVTAGDFKSQVTVSMSYN